MRVDMGRSSNVHQYKHKRSENPGDDIWREIPGFESVYEINYHGKIRRTCGKGKRTITPITKRGVAVVRLVLPGGQRKEYRLHTLVAKAFLAPPAQPGMVLYHPNGARKDNCAGNLEWITSKELGRKTGAAAKRRPVIKMDSQGDIVAFYPSARASARENYMSYQTIIDRCNGKCKSPFAPDGYMYKWDDEETDNEPTRLGIKG